MQNTLSYKRRVDRFLLLLPPSFGRRWRVAPEVGFALFAFGQPPCPLGIPLPSEGGRWATHPASPSFLWKEVARSAGGWLCPISLSANLRPSGIPLPWERGDGLLIPLLPPSFGRRWRVAPEVGFALFRLQPTPALRASPFHGKGVDELLIPLLPPSTGRKWRIAPEVGFALFRLRPTPALRASPFHGKGVDFSPLLPLFSGRRRSAI